MRHSGAHKLKATVAISAAADAKLTQSGLSISFKDILIQVQCVHLAGKVVKADETRHLFISNGPCAKLPIHVDTGKLLPPKLSLLNKFSVNIQILTSFFQLWGNSGRVNILNNYILLFQLYIGDCNFFSICIVNLLLNFNICKQFTI